MPLRLIAHLWIASLPSEPEGLERGEYAGDTVPVPPDAPRKTTGGAPKAASQGRIFLNFEGAQLGSGFDDSIHDITQIDECAGAFAAYGDGPKREAAIQAVRDDWAPYDVVVTDTRPGSGDYTMCMTGPSNPFGGGVLGIAPIDCDDSQTHNNVVFAFHSANDGFDASTQATTISQEVAHSYGLEHVDAPGDIMNPFNAGGDPSFTDQCIGIVGGGVFCGNQHEAQCGSPGSQNSHRELMALFGASMPDGQAPSVQITAPLDGAELEVGASFAIAVEASDDNAIERVVLSNNGDEIETDASSPYGWQVANAPAGTYELQVEAIDAAGNSAMSDVVTVHVGAGAADDGGSEDDGGESDGDADDDASDDDGAFDDGGLGELPPEYGRDGRPEGCACATGRNGGQGWFLGVALLALTTRSRRSRSD